MSVVMNPGATAFTVMLRLANSLRQRFGETDQSGFARSVICLPGIANQPDHRADVNDASAPLFGHRTKNRVGKTKRAAQVRVDHRVPIFH